jgi:hypothetical protein
MIALNLGKTSFWRNQTRISRAFVCGGAGWIVSIGMVNWGGAMERYLPDTGVHTCAFLGALLSGYVLASGFGRRGHWGLALAVLSACIATISGAIIGGGLLGLFLGGDPEEGAFLGLISIAYSVESYWLILTWVVSMIGVDAFARWGPFAPRLNKML